MISALVIAASLGAPAIAAGDAAIAAFQAELTKGQQLHARLSGLLAEKSKEAKAPTQSFLHARESLNALESRLRSGAKTAKALIPAAKSRDVGVQNAATGALINLTSQLRSVREQTAREVDACLHSPAPKN
jgi:hypothetical protein